MLYRISNAVLSCFVWLVERYENAVKKFVTFHKRPMYAKDVLTEPLPGSDYARCAIVVQGPLLREHDFTLETVRLYRKHFPKALIVVSTWDNEERSCVADIEREAVALLNGAPAYRGPNNVNLQTASTIAGIRFARERGAKYILKTRTDQRMYNPYLLASLVDLVNHFPVQRGLAQNKRFVGLSCGNMRDYYRLSDMFQFGDADDMLAYWSADHIAAESAAEKKFTAAETYLFREYLRKTGGDPKLTAEDSERAYQERCIFIDPALADWYWHKRKRHREFRYTAYGSSVPRSVSFFEWLHAFMRRD